MIKCPNCSTENRDQAKFCDECGFPLTGKIAEAAQDISSALTAQLAVVENEEEAEQETREELAEESGASEADAESKEHELPEESEQDTGEIESDLFEDEEEFIAVDPTMPFEEIPEDVEGAPEEGDEDLPDADKAESEEAEPYSDPDDVDIETDYDLYAPGATRIDLSGIDERVYDDLTGYIPEIELSDESSVRDGLTMQFEAIEEEVPAKAKTFKAKEKEPFSISVAPATRKRLLIGAAAVLVVAIVAFATYQMELWGGKSIPNVVGMTEAEATSVLSGQGFKVRSAQVKSDDTEGLVLVMDPSSGSRISTDEEVVIHIATARSIPNVIGKSEAQAVVAFTDEGYENVKYEKELSSKPEGTVISVEPAVGSRAKSSAEIVVKVAQPFAVPDISNMYLDEAQETIEAAHLVPEIRIVYTEDYPDGNIMGTDPATGTKVEEGSTVYIEIARSRAAELESAARAYLAPGATISIGLQGYQVESLETVKYAGGNTVSYTMYAKPYITAFGETAFFSTQILSGQIEFDDSNNVLSIS